MNCPHCGKKINVAALMVRRRVQTQTKERRAEIARNAAIAMWDKRRQQDMLKKKALMVKRALYLAKRARRKRP